MKRKKKKQIGAVSHCIFFFFFFSLEPYITLTSKLLKLFGNVLHALLEFRNKKESADVGSRWVNRESPHCLQLQTRTFNEKET